MFWCFLVENYGVCISVNVLQTREDIQEHNTCAVWLYMPLSSKYFNPQYPVLDLYKNSFFHFISFIINN